MDTLSVINENELPRRKFNRETIRKFKKKISDPVFFQQLKLEVQAATDELSKLRLGGQLSVQYVKSMRDSSVGSPTRKFIKHDNEFRDYLIQNPTANKAPVDFTNFSCTNHGNHKLMFDYPGLEHIRTNVHRIRKS